MKDMDMIERVTMTARPVTPAHEFARVALANSSLPRWPVNMADIKVIK